MMDSVAMRSAYDRERETPDHVWMTQPIGGIAHTLSWREAMDEARRVAAWLRDLGLPPRSHIAIFAKNSARWVLADLAIWMAGHVSVPVYPTLTWRSVAQIFDHGDVGLVFVGKLDNFADMAPGIPADLIRIGLPGCAVDLRPDRSLEDPGQSGQLDTTWAEILRTSAPIKDNPSPSPRDVATVIYTSGSTGTPKGVMLSFANMAASALGVIDMMAICSRDRMLSYLPLAHVYERWIVQTVSLMAGTQIFFNESLATFSDDLRRARPTIFVSVPRLWQKFQVDVLSRIPSAALEAALADPATATAARKEALSIVGLASVRFAISGSAPISIELLDWYRKVGLEIREGYGMTENFAYSHITRPGDQRCGLVGQPYPDVQCKITAEGEIIVRSPGTMVGYYRDEEATAAAMTVDGFLRTGDLGHADATGRLRITGRTKEQFKSSKGKYVAPAPIEGLVVDHAAISMACVRGAGFAQPHALVTLQAAHPPDRSSLMALEASLTAHLDDLNASLDRHERLAFIAIVEGAWLIENGALTPTMKLRRAVLEQRWRSCTADWYDDVEHAPDRRILWVKRPGD